MQATTVELSARKMGMLQYFHFTCLIMKKIFSTQLVEEGMKSPVEDECSYYCALSLIVKLMNIVFTISSKFTNKNIHNIEKSKKEVNIKLAR